MVHAEAHDLVTPGRRKSRLVRQLIYMFACVRLHESSMAVAWQLLLPALLNNNSLPYQAPTTSVMRTLIATTFKSRMVVEMDKIVTTSELQPYIELRVGLPVFVESSGIVLRLSRVEGRRT